MPFFVNVNDETVKTLHQELDNLERRCLEKVAADVGDDDYKEFLQTLLKSCGVFRGVVSIFDPISSEQVRSRMEELIAMLPKELNELVEPTGIHTEITLEDEIDQRAARLLIESVYSKHRVFEIVFNKLHIYETERFVPKDKQVKPEDFGVLTEPVLVEKQ